MIKITLNLTGAFKNSQNIHVSKLNTRHETFDEGDQFQVLCGRIFPKFSETNISAVYLGNESITLVNLMLHLPGWFQSGPTPIYLLNFPEKCCPKNLLYKFG